MSRIYLMPKIIFLTLLFIIFTKMTEWYFVLLFIIISSVITIIYTFVYLYIIGRIYAIKLEKGNPVSKEKAYSIVHRLIKLANTFLRVKINVTGYEHFDPNNTYLIIPNHQSNMDALVMMETFKDPISFVSKFSMSEVILVKDYMRAIGCLFLKKDDMRSQIIVMNEVAQKLKEGDSVIIFPEGKRSYSPVMNEFKPGTFKMATKTHVDILPVTMNHVHKMRHQFPWKLTHIDVHIHPAITYEDYQKLSTGEIADKVKATIQTKIQE